MKCGISCLLGKMLALEAFSVSCSLGTLSLEFLSPGFLSLKEMERMGGNVPDGIWGPELTANGPLEIVGSSKMQVRAVVAAGRSRRVWHLTKLFNSCCNTP